MFLTAFLGLCSTPSNGGCSDGCEITPSGVLCSCPAELELMTTGQCSRCFYYVTHCCVTSQHHVCI